MPLDGQSQFQPAPMDVLRDIAKPFSQDGGTLVKTCLRKGKNAVEIEEGGTKRVRKSRQKTKA